MFVWKWVTAIQAPFMLPLPVKTANRTAASSRREPGKW